MDSIVVQLDQSSTGAGRSSYPQERSIPTSSSRRSACDRCRARKLRCSRVPDSNFFTDSTRTGGPPPCERCTKAGADCLYTIRTRRTPPWWCGYDRHVFKSSATFPYFYQLPLEDTLGSEVGGQMCLGSRCRMPFEAHMPAPPPPPGESHAHMTSVPKHHIGPDHGSTERGSNFHWPMATDVSGANLSTICGNFPFMTSPNVHPSQKSNSGHSIPSDINDQSLGMASSFAPRQWQDHAFAMSEILAGDQSNRGTDCGVPVVESNVSKEPRFPVTAQWPGTREECLRELMDLTSRLIVCFSFTEDRPSVDLQDILASSPRDQNHYAEISNVSETGKSMVRSLLESSQLFLDIVERLKSLTMPVKEDQTSCSPSTSSESDYSIIDSPLLTGSSSSYETCSMTYKQNCDRHNEVEMEDLSKRQQSGHLNTQKMPMTPSMLSPHLNKYFSLPTTFTIISCYMWLFRGYEAVFAAIHNALVVQNNQARGGMQENRTDQLNSKGKKPDLVIFPDIKIGGIDLDCHPHVQIEMLIHVSCQMLQRIEAALGIDPTTSRDGTTTLQNLPAGAGRDGMLNVTAAPALLQTFLHGGGFDSCSVGDKVPKSARMSLDSGILQSILENLRGCREFAANQI